MIPKHLTLLFIVFLLSSCGKPAQPVAPIAISASGTATNLPATETSTAISFTETSPIPTSNSTIFGAILQSEIQAFSLEPIANAIFGKVMDGFIANGDIIEYQVTRVTIFPTGDGSLYAEITYNVRTPDTHWLVDGGTQSSDDWINDKCNRFDFVTTETEYQLKNKRTCN